MQDNLQHLVFYDGTCGLCDHTVQILLKADKKCILAFAPLQGETASNMLANLPANLKTVDSVILIENFRKADKQIYTESKAAFRICWLLGGLWKLIGVLSFLPSFLFDWAYRLVARNRYQWIAQRCLVPQKNQRDRFLP